VQHRQGGFNRYGSRAGRSALALLGGDERRTASRQDQATTDGQEHQGLEQQEEQANGRAGRDLHLGLDQQAEQKQHRGLEGQHLGCGE
jgi:hypothetical protein